MQVSVEVNEGLERRMSVAVPDEKVSSEVESRLKSMSRTASVHGFRRGKVPMRIMKQQFGRQVHQEVVAKILESSYTEALSQENLRPAGNPTIDEIDTTPGKGLSYTAVFEVYPDVPMVDPEKLKVTRMEAEITDEDLDGMIDTLRKQHRTWEAVEREAAMEDRVTVDFIGTMDGETFKGGEAKELPMELGNSNLIAGFEEGLIGMKAGDEKVMELTFPEDYHDKEKAGRSVIFNVKAGKVEEARLPEVDAEFARSLGVVDGTEESLRNEIRANMERELAEAIEGKLKGSVLNALMESNSMDVPKGMVQEEAEKLRKQAEQQMSMQGVQQGGGQMDLSLFEESAQRRVVLGLLVAKIIEEENLRAEADKVRARVESIASTYQQPKEVLDWYYADPQRLADIETLVLENQVVDWLVSKAQVEVQKRAFQEVMAPEPADSE